MLYQAYQAHCDAFAPVRLMAETARGWLSQPFFHYMPVARGAHAAAMSSKPDQTPVAMPARNAAPSVVASVTGETSTRRWVASASACRNVAFALMPPSTRKVPTA